MKRNTDGVGSGIRFGLGFGIGIGIGIGFGIGTDRLPRMAKHETVFFWKST